MISNISVPFFGVDRQFSEHREGLMQVTEQALASGKVLQGPDVIELEKELADLCGRRFGVAVGSCTDALTFSLAALQIGEGDEVIVPSLSFFASVSCILRVGAIPIFADIETDYGMLDINKLTSLFSSKTKAIIGVHLYGQTLSMDYLEKIAGHYGVALIEDAAQALGATDNKRPAGSMGKVSCISFDPTKILNASGSGGIVLTDDELIYETVKRLRYHGRDPQTRDIVQLGYNSQLASDKAAQLRYKLKFLSDWQSRRSDIAKYYNRELSDIPGLSTPRIRPGSTHNWHKYVLQVDCRRNELKNYLSGVGINSMIHYDKTLADEPVIKETNLDNMEINIPNAQRMVARVLSLPIYPELTDKEVKFVVSGVKNYYLQCSEKAIA